MIVGVCMLELIIYESNSLKDKRLVVKSIIDRLKSRFNISISEIGLNDSWRNSLIAFAYVSNSTNQTNKVISNVINFIDQDSRVEIIKHEIEIL